MTNEQLMMAISDHCHKHPHCGHQPAILLVSKVIAIPINHVAEATQEEAMVLRVPVGSLILHGDAGK